MLLARMRTETKSPESLGKQPAPRLLFMHWSMRMKIERLRGLPVTRVGLYRKHDVIPDTSGIDFPLNFLNVKAVF